MLMTGILVANYLVYLLAVLLGYFVDVVLVIAVYFFVFEIVAIRKQINIWVFGMCLYGFTIKCAVLSLANVALRSNPYIATLATILIIIDQCFTIKNIQLQISNSVLPFTQRSYLLM
jgi:hypothetical protein